MDNFRAGGFEWYALKLTAVIVLVFALSLVFPDIVLEFRLVSSQVLEKPWTIITHIFLHGSFVHLFYNMFALALFGSILEKEIGSRRFLLIFFTGGVASSFADIIFYTSTIGASGAIFAVIGALAVIKPKQVVWALGVPMYMILAAGVWAVFDMIGAFYPDNVAHMSHLLGLAFGILIGFYLKAGRKQAKLKEEEEGEAVSEEELERWEEKYMIGGR
jgi:hypothetical protein